MNNNIHQQLEQTSGPDLVMKHLKLSMKDELAAVGKRFF
jgi:hypothetical protein